jgi:hypothetical protein
MHYDVTETLSSVELRRAPVLVVGMSGYRRAMNTCISRVKTIANVKKMM